MAQRTWTSIWAKTVSRGLRALGKASRPTRKRAAASRAVPAALKRAAARPVASARVGVKVSGKAGDTVAPGHGHWLAGVAIGPAGTRRYRLYRPPGLRAGEHVPLLVMLHGCGQDANGFASSTRMNRVAERERFVVLYPEQDRRANAQGCWNWFDTQSGRAYGEAATSWRPSTRSACCTRSTASVWRWRACQPVPAWQRCW